MAQPKKSDRRFTAALAELEESTPIGKVPLPPKDRRGKNSSANHRAGRGGRSKATTKVYRAKKVARKISCYVARR